MTDDKRNLHVDVMRGKRKRPGCISKQTVVPVGSALVRGIDHYGIVIHSQFLQFPHNGADAVIHHGCFRGGVDHRRLIIQRLYGRPCGCAFLHHQARRPAPALGPVFQVRMYFFLRHGRGIFRVIRGMPVIWFHGYRRRQVIRAVIGEIQEKRLVLFLSGKKINRFLCPEISQVSGNYISLAVIDHCLIIKRGRVSRGKCYPVSEPQLRCMRHA